MLEQQTRRPWPARAMEIKTMKYEWKTDPNFTWTIIDLDGNYVGQVKDDVDRVNIIDAHNVAIRQAFCDGGSASRKEDIAKFLPMVKQEIASQRNTPIDMRTVVKENPDTPL